MKAYITTTNDIATRTNNAAVIFDTIKKMYHPTNAERLYLKTVQTYREDGSMKPLRECDKVLMAHKKWARVDTSDIKVSYQVKTDAKGLNIYTIIFEA